MKTFILTFQTEIEAEDEEEAKEKLFKSIEENNETIENHFFENLKVEENKTAKLF